MIKPSWIAVDWGTSNLRVWAMSNASEPLAMRHSNKGMLGLNREDFEPALLALISDWLSKGAVTQTICCGMVGARQGWAEAGYRTAPCKATEAEQSTRVATVDPRIRVDILPGVMQKTPADVMRGEETQIAGFLAEVPDFKGVICLPGTHSKWVRVSNGNIVHFTTLMTGELFSLISKHSVLRHSVSTDGWDNSAFIDAIEKAAANPVRVVAELFSVRASSLLGRLSPTEARAQLSGLLMGQEIAAMRDVWQGQKLAILGADTLAELYNTALNHLGARSTCHDIERLTPAGCAMAFNQMECTK